MNEQHHDFGIGCRLGFPDGNRKITGREGELFHLQNTDDPTSGIEQLTTQQIYERLGWMNGITERPESR